MKTLQKDRTKKKVKAISLLDGVIVLVLPIQLLISWCLPARLWYGVARLLEPLIIPLYVKGGSRTEGVVRSVMGGYSTSISPRKIIQQLAREEFVSILQILRDYRPGGWRPSIKLIGTENLADALQRGNGAILWVSYTNGAKLVGKIAIHRIGYAVAHLSRPRHGLSPTRFGICLLNQIQTTIENRYIAERLIVDDGEFHKVLRTLMAYLKSNRVISITVHRDAVRPTKVPFLKGEITLADGACRLAYRTGASLLPVFVFRDSAGLLNVRIDTAIDVRKTEEELSSVTSAHRDYVAQLEPFVLAYPGQWRGWYHLL